MKAYFCSPNRTRNEGERRISLHDAEMCVFGCRSVWLYMQHGFLTHSIESLSRLDSDDVPRKNIVLTICTSRRTNCSHRGSAGHDHPRVREQGRFQGRAQTTAFSATRRWHIGVGRVSWNRSYYHDSNRVNGFHALFFTFLGHDREAGQSATYHLRAAKILNLLHFRVLLQSGENSTPRLQPFSMQNMVKDVWS